MLDQKLTLRKPLPSRDAHSCRCLSTRGLARADGCALGGCARVGPVHASVSTALALAFLPRPWLSCRPPRGPGDCRCPSGSWGEGGCSAEEAGAFVTSSLPISIVQCQVLEFYSDNSWWIKLQNLITGFF